jgi:hypothetical protein
MKNHTLHFFMLFTFIIFVYASVIQGTAHGKEGIKFSTEKVRAMWYMCSTQFQRVAPHIDQPERVRLCDCYVDHMRTTFTPEQVLALTSEQSKELGKKMNIICPTQVPFTIKEAT